MRERDVDQTLKLSDGRHLGFAEYGSLSGKPVFFFNGSGGSRLGHPADESILSDLDIRFISTDRPGHGLSDPKPDRELLDWPNDVSELASHLSIDEFYVLGWSAGGPHALACAYKLEDRVRAGAIVSGPAPPNRPAPYRGLPLGHRVVMFVLRRFPRFNYSLRRGMYSLMKADDETIDAKLQVSFPPEDAMLLQDSVHRKMLVADLREGYRQGWHGPARDDIVIFTPWRFRLQDVRVRIDVWQGDMDRNVPFNQGQYQHEWISNSRLTVVQGQAHLYLLVMWRDVLRALVE